MKKVLLVIRDGRGYRTDTTDNAIAQAHTPFTDMLMEKYPHTLLAASGEAVGLPEGYQGNSEVGHITIGSGRVMFQSLVRINKSIADGSFFRNEAFVQAIQNCKKNNSTLHLIALLQDQGVHAHVDHLYALLDLCKRYEFSNVYIHAITDGRDAPVTESLKHLKLLENKLSALGFGEIVTISGRYYAMDRDTRWDRTKKAYDCMVDGVSSEAEFSNEIAAVEACHAGETFDEFIVPMKKVGYEGMADNDSVIFVNFRTDRTRQLTHAITEDAFDGFERTKKDVLFVAMTQYYQNLNGLVAFEDQSSKNFLGEVVSRAGYQQLRISETEKYAHVTFFFNGQAEEPNNNEKRILIDSPKVATYDLQPEMEVREISDALSDEIDKDKYHMIVTNFVNGDMVGHTGKVDAIITGLEAVDKALEKTIQHALEHDYMVLIFADHGNAEDQSAEWRTSHTLNPVPCILVGNDVEHIQLKDGKGLQDIAPTVLDIMGIEKPVEMTGESLIN